MPGIVALQIGELPNMPRLNDITLRIVERAVARWRGSPSSVLVCESCPMGEVALAHGLPPDRLRIAIPEPSGHTTRWAAERIRVMPEVAQAGGVLLITHRLHAGRAARMFRSLGLRTAVEGLAIPFNPGDLDWKLRSDLAFRSYNAIAYAYCFARGWLSL